MIQTWLRKHCLSVFYFFLLAAVFFPITTSAITMGDLIQAQGGLLYESEHPLINTARITVTYAVVSYTEGRWQYLLSWLRKNEGSVYLYIDEKFAGHGGKSGAVTVDMPPAATETIITVYGRPNKQSFIASGSIDVLPSDIAAQCGGYSGCPSELDDGGCHFLDCRSESLAVVPSIPVLGDENCTQQTQAALLLLQEKSPAHFFDARRYVGIIECVKAGSNINPALNPPRYQAGEVTRQAGTLWYAGTIVHDACHSMLYAQYSASHPGEIVPADVWTGKQAETTCLAVQLDALANMGADKQMLSYVQSVGNTNYWENEDRTW